MFKLADHANKSKNSIVDFSGLYFFIRMLCSHDAEAIWHIPMWLIRNSLSLAEMIPLFIWAVLISIVLGRKNN